MIAYLNPYRRNDLIGSLLVSYLQMPIIDTNIYLRT